MEDKKEFIIPVAEIIEFHNEDIILTSDGWWGGIGGVDDTQVP